MFSYSGAREADTYRGKIVGRVARCTQLVATEAQYQKQGARVKEATAASVPIVSYDWLTVSLDSTDRVACEPYYVRQNSSSSSPVNNTTIKQSASSEDQAAAKPTECGTLSGDPAVGASEVAAEVDDANSTVVYNSSVKASNTTLKRTSDKIDPGEVSSHVPEGKKAKTTQPAMVPVDRGYQGKSVNVCKGESGEWYDATLNQVDHEKNANKFYRIQVLEDASGGYTCVSTPYLGILYEWIGQSLTMPPVDSLGSSRGDWSKKGSWRRQPCCRSLTVRAKVQGKDRPPLAESSGRTKIGKVHFH